MESPRAEAAAPGLLFDPEALLVREPRVLLDPRFLGALHAELEDELGSEPAAVTLLQIGFLHGLRDALQAVVQLVAGGRRRRAGRPALARCRRGCAPSPAAAAARRDRAARLLARALRGVGAAREPRTLRARRLRRERRLHLGLALRALRRRHRRARDELRRQRRRGLSLRGARGGGLARRRRTPRPAPCSRPSPSQPCATAIRGESAPAQSPPAASTARRR